MVKVAQSCLTLCNCVVHGILQARILEWVAFLSSRGSSQPTDQTQVSCIAGGFFSCWTCLKHTQVVQHFQHSLCGRWFVPIQTSFSFIISSADSQNWPCLRESDWKLENFVFLKHIASISHILIYFRSSSPETLYFTFSKEKTCRLLPRWNTGNQ